MSTPSGTGSSASSEVFRADDAARIFASGSEDDKAELIQKATAHYYSKELGDPSKVSAAQETLDETINTILTHISSNTDRSSGPDGDFAPIDINVEPPLEDKEYVDSLVSRMLPDEQEIYHGYIQSAVTCANPTEAGSYVDKAEITNAEIDTTRHSPGSTSPGGYFAPQSPSSYSQ
jgi:hypothetical protein